MPVVVIYNPVCGDSTAEQFFNAHVIPRLQTGTAAQIPAQVIRTSAPGDGGRQVLDLLNRHKGDITVVLGSGDGTLHEIANHLAFTTDGEQSFPVRLALIPCGTANALYASLFSPHSQEPVAYRLQSLDAFLAASTTKPLTLSLTSFVGSPCPNRGLPDPRPIASVVVTSTALHAAILRDSEKLRKEIPGIERFKVAAQQNITKWYASRVKLLPIPSSGVVHTYDLQKGELVPVGNPSSSCSALDVHGPFAYFLSTVNVDRLEPEFRINPIITKLPPTETSMDVLMIRPHRDPTFVTDTPQAREKFAEKVVAVLTSAYQDGNHISLRYSEDGNLTRDGHGSTVVEYFRCGGWEWIPDETDKDAHFLCADGSISEIEKGGRAICKVASRTDMTLRNFCVYV